MVKLTSFLLWNGYHNIPKNLLNEQCLKELFMNIHGITPPVVFNYTKNWVFSEHAPWTRENQNENNPADVKRIIPIVPPLKEWFWFRGDFVEILNGKDSGKQGSIVGVIKQRNWVIVSGLNTKLELMRQDTACICRKVEKPLVVNRDVKLIDPFDKKPCDVIWRYLEDGTKVRVSKRSGRIIPLPVEAESTVDYVKKSNYKPSEIDTEVAEVRKRTFKPSLKTFENDLMDEYQIKEERTRAETYIY